MQNVISNNYFIENFLPLLLCDFYKISHREAYPEDTEVIYSALTARSNKHLPISDKVVAFGFQAFVKEYLIKEFNEHFFNLPIESIIQHYKLIISNSLFIPMDEINTTHIEELHALGYLPLRVRAIEEGTLVPLQVPVLTIENTVDGFHWLTNYLETLVSSELWLGMTSATQAYAMRKMLNEYARKTVGNTDAVEFQMHDFSMRGMSSLKSAAISGSAHLLFSKGTDTIAAILQHQKFYNADITKEVIGSSINATEHSVMSANTDADGNRDETATYRRLITKVFPNGFVSLVSDTYDFFGVVDNVLPALKDDIMKRDGRVIIRPDSGNPVDILCGIQGTYAKDYEKTSEEKGLIEALWDIFGGTINELGYKELDTHIGAIYGDSITYDRAKEICERLIAKGFATTNIVFGVGSYTYQYVTRDSFGFAIKALSGKFGGTERALFKDPKTDIGKRSHRGRVVVYKNADGEIVAKDGFDSVSALEFEKVNGTLLQDVFVDGQLYNETSLSEIRERTYQYI